MTIFYRIEMIWNIISKLWSEFEIEQGLNVPENLADSQAYLVQSALVSAILA